MLVELQEVIKKLYLKYINEYQYRANIYDKQHWAGKISVLQEICSNLNIPYHDYNLDISQYKTNTFEKEKDMLEYKIKLLQKEIEIKDRLIESQREISNTVLYLKEHLKVLEKATENTRNNFFN